MAACSLIAPLEEIKGSSATGEAASKAEARAEAKAADDGGQEAPAMGRADRPGAPHDAGAADGGAVAARGGKDDAGSSSRPPVADAGAKSAEQDAGSTLDDAMCDPLAPQRPRPGLRPCAAGQACILHDDALRGSVAPTSCEPPGSGIEGTPCTMNTDCASGLFCETKLLTCHRYCATGSDCPGLGVCIPLEPAFLLGTTQLTVGACPNLSL